jgi:hypothetical protein
VWLHERHPNDLYGRLRDWACQEYPDDLEKAFRKLCGLARLWADPSTMQFKLWASDFRNRDDAEALRVLSRMDVNAFFRRHPVEPPSQSA